MAVSIMLLLLKMWPTLAVVIGVFLVIKLIFSLPARAVLLLLPTLW